MANNKQVFIVAEIGCNHCGDVAMARQMVEQAALCGVDAVKFQSFIPAALTSKYAPMAAYQKANTGNNESQLAMLEKLKLSASDYHDLLLYGKSLGLEVFSTPFDMESMDSLVDEGQRIWKIPSGEITNLPYLERIASLQCSGKHIILSTGMSTISEVRDAVSILLSGSKPERFMVLHCNTQYPTPDADVNLRAMLTLKAEFPMLEVGFSDHSLGSEAAIAATALGATMIEKHFTLDKNLPGPDHKASATPDELLHLVQAVRRTEVMMGSAEKHVTESERQNITVARKSIVAARPIAKGELFTADNLTCKRPGNGLSPMLWHSVIGTQAIRNFDTDELISL